MYFNNLNHLRPKSTVVATVSSPLDLSSLEKVTSGEPAPSHLEFRLDLLQASGCLAEADEFLRKRGFRQDVLLTARRPDEGGSGNLNARARQDLLLDRLDEARLVDVEIQSLETESWDSFREAIDASTIPPTLVGSYHDFESTPSKEELRDVIERGIEAEVDVVKIATRLHTKDDILLLESLLNKPPIPLSVMGMGDMGKASRLILALAGSVLNYGYSGEENAPGQWQANELAETLADVG